jgi:hypothetical protein
MMQDLIGSEWFWLIAVGFFTVLLGLVAYRDRRTTRRNSRHSNWVPTGRIDFVGPTGQDHGTPRKFELQAEEISIVSSIGGLDHHEIRWRAATLGEAKTVVTIYHAHAHLVRRPPMASSVSIVPELDAAGATDAAPSRAHTIAVVRART